ncbi:MAG: hypothetical protein HY652_07180 [Acidobacteria bacterium]|nr:hypothetical protein [Acidobacteriota bacterium]
MTGTVTVNPSVQLRAWLHEVKGIGGFMVPVYFLDSDLPDNGEPDRRLTHFLCGGDWLYRLCQEVILGIGGVRMLHWVRQMTHLRIFTQAGYPFEQAQSLQVTVK